MPSHSLSLMAAGAAAALTVDLIVYPLDTIKTRIQSNDPKYRWGSRALYRGGYHGMGPVILATLPASAAFFSTYEATNTLLSKTLPKSIPTPLQHSFSSAFAECVSCAILCPAEVIKQKAQMVDTSGSAPTVRIVKSFAGRPTVLWSGYLSLVARNLPFTAMQFPIFEWVRKTEPVSRIRLPRFGDGKGDRSIHQNATDSLLRNSIAAGSAASVASTFTTPIDLVKTRVMLAAGDAEAAAKGYSGVIREIWGTDGVKGFFRGGAIRIVWMAIGSGLYLGTYEAAKVWLGVGERTAGEEHQ